MYLGNFRDYSVMIGNLIMFRIPSGKHRMHSDMRFPEGIRNFIRFPIFTDLYRLLTEMAEVHYTPVTLK